ncbi:hypothetical protein GCM10025780_21010 [Frondihabitans cladoniiphilus]|uniref:Uncharacterized protein n=1 Tax=Frondihabitans cladoniiphilus TaxID=715785 RepID=A0ABP8VZ12_9MICO
MFHVKQWLETQVCLESRLLLTPLRLLMPLQLRRQEPLGLTLLLWPSLASARPVAPRTPLRPRLWPML